MTLTIGTGNHRNRRRATFLIVAAPLVAISATTGMVYDFAKTGSLPKQTLASSFHGQYNNKLCGNYRIIRTGSNEVIILRRSNSQAETDALADPTNGTYVGGNIRQIAVKAPFVIGYATPLGGLEMSDSKTGFFVLNTEWDELEEGLSPEKFNSELKRIGWQNPHLREPR